MLDNIFKMKKYKSMKSILQVGDFILTPDREVYEVLRLGIDTFDCRNVNSIVDHFSNVVVFYYTIEMRILRQIAKSK